MPPLSRAFVRAGLLALTLGLLLECLLARPAEWWPSLPDAALQLGAIHLLTVGWLLQLITGIAFWMFPRHPSSPPRGDSRPGWAAFGLLNLGLVFRLVGEPWQLAFGGPQWPLAVAALLQFAAVILVVRLLWPRVRSTGS